MKFPVFKTFPDELCRRNTMFLMNSRLRDTSKEKSFKRNDYKRIGVVEWFCRYIKMIMGLPSNDNLEKAHNIRNVELRYLSVLICFYLSVPLSNDFLVFIKFLSCKCFFD